MALAERYRQPVRSVVLGIQATLFGDFELTVDGEDVRPRSRKSAALLAYVIASDRKGASRTRLASLFWSDRGEEQARASLRQAIAELRSGPPAIARALNVSRQDVSLVPDMIVSDLDRFAAASGRRDAQELTRLVEEIRGGFLDDLDDLSPAFNEWLQIERIQQRDHLVEMILDAIPRFERGAENDVRRLLGAVERIDPLNEAVVRLRLELAHAAGDTASMHRCYRRLVDDLARELSVAPARATRELFERLLAPSEQGNVIAVSASPTTSRMPPVILVTAFTANGGEAALQTASIITEDVRISLARSTTVRVFMADRLEESHARATTENAVAAYRLNGSVRLEGNQVTVNVQLGTIATGLLVWSEQMRLIFGGGTSIDELVARVSGSVRAAVEHDVANLDGGQQSAASAGQEATLLYARGRRLVRDARTLAAAQESADLLEQVIRVDPRHVGARLRLAQLYNTDFQHLVAGHDVASYRARAFDLTVEAAEFNPADVHVQLRLAWCYLRRRDWSRAERMLRTTSAAMPHDADALNECGFGLAHLGELDLAETLIQRAFQLNPFAPAEYHADLAVLLALGDKRAAAEEHFEVCNEHRLLYQLVRLGNLYALDGPSPRLTALQTRFVEAFKDIWQPVRQPTMSDVVEWIDYTLCLRKPEHRQPIVDSAKAAWLAVT